MRELIRSFRNKVLFFLAFFISTANSTINVHVNSRAALFAAFFSRGERETRQLEEYGVDGALELQKKYLSAVIACSLTKDFLKASFETIVRYWVSAGIFKIGEFDLSSDFQKAENDYKKIWKKKKPALIRQKKRILQCWQNAKLDVWLPRIRNFYGSNFQIERPIDIFLAPMLGSKIRTGSLLWSLVFLQTSDKANATDDVGIIVHELCHHLFMTMSDYSRKVFNSFCDKSLYAFLACNYLDEAIATAIGNRFIEKQIRGKISQEAYANEYIDKYSMALFPIVEEYINETKQIDESFMKRAIEIFAQTFPDAVRDYEKLFFDFSVFSDFKRSDLFRCFMGTFPVFGMRIIPVNEVKTTDTHQPFSLFILNNTQHIPGITLNNQPDSLYVNKEKNFIVIQTDCLKNIGKALQILKSQKYFTRSFLCKLNS